MNVQCSREHCYPEHTGCAEGFLIHECPYYKHRSKDTTDDSTPERDGDLSLVPPWSGATFGTDDAFFVGGVSRLHTIALMGPTDAGKTTLLSAHHALLSKGARFASYAFAGSYTLAGWEVLSRHLEWGEGKPARFPPHTSIPEGRVPGLLHSAYGSSQHRLHTLWTDAPGEWFERWAIDKNDPVAEGAKWIAERASVVVLIADGRALRSTGANQAREKLMYLARRVANEVPDREKAIVWTKDDAPGPASAKARVFADLEKQLPGVRTFSTGIGSGSAPFVELFSWVIEAMQRVSRPSIPTPTLTSSDPLFNFRRLN